MTVYLRILSVCSSVSDFIYFLEISKKNKCVLTVCVNIYFSARFYTAIGIVTIVYV